LTDGAEEIFIDLIDRRVDKSYNIDTIFVLGLADKIMMDVLSVCDNAFSSICDEVRVEDCLTLPGPYISGSC